MTHFSAHKALPAAALIAAAIAFTPPAQAASTPISRAVQRATRGPDPRAVRRASVAAAQTEMPTLHLNLRLVGSGTVKATVSLSGPNSGFSGPGLLRLFVKHAGRQGYGRLLNAFGQNSLPFHQEVGARPGRKLVFTVTWASDNYGHEQISRSIRVGG